MKALLTGTAILTPAYLYTLIPNTVITYESTILFTLISLLSLSILGAIVALTKGAK